MPHEYYELSGLLFWVIISIGARRLKSQPTLLPKLAHNVTDLLWRTVRTAPHSVHVVRAIALLCTWPFPASISTSDPTFMLTGLMIQMGVQMGLNRPVDAQDFSKAPLELTDKELAEWTRTWEACMIVSQRSVHVPAKQYSAEISHLICIDILKIYSPVRILGAACKHPYSSTAQAYRKTMGYAMI